MSLWASNAQLGSGPERVGLLLWSLAGLMRIRETGSIALCCDILAAEDWPQYVIIIIALLLMMEAAILRV